MATNPTYSPIDSNCTHTLNHENSVFVVYPLSRLRLIGAEFREGFTSKQAKALLDLHGQELTDLLDKTVKDFIKKKVG